MGLAGEEIEAVEAQLGAAAGMQVCLVSSRWRRAPEAATVWLKMAVGERVTVAWLTEEPLRGSSWARTMRSTIAPGARVMARDACETEAPSLS